MTIVSFFSKAKYPLLKYLLIFSFNLSENIMKSFCKRYKKRKKLFNFISCLWSKKARNHLVEYSFVFCFCKFLCDSITILERHQRILNIFFSARMTLVTPSCFLSRYLEVVRVLKQADERIINITKKVEQTVSRIFKEWNKNYDCLK